MIFAARGLYSSGLPCSWWGVSGGRLHDVRGVAAVPCGGGGCAGPRDNSSFIICFFHISGKFMNVGIVLPFFLN